MSSIPKGALPEGTWISFWHWPQGATGEDLRQIILNRTGVDIGAGRVAIRPDHVAVVSITKDHIRQILQWALSDDEIYGCRLDCLEQPPSRDTRRG